MIVAMKPKMTIIAITFVVVVILGGCNNTYKTQPNPTPAPSNFQEPESTSGQSIQADSKSKTEPESEGETYCSQTFDSFYSDNKIVPSFTFERPCGEQVPFLSADDVNPTVPNSPTYVLSETFTIYQGTKEIRGKEHPNSIGYLEISIDIIGSHSGAFADSPRSAVDKVIERDSQISPDFKILEWGVINVAGYSAEYVKYELIGLVFWFASFEHAHYLWDFTCGSDEEYAQDAEAHFKHLLNTFRFLE